jgi:uracil-DNA glycosylase
MAEEQTLEAIAAEVRGCMKCALHVGAKNAVPGQGDPHAEVMLIGEAPSLYDDRSGQPFSGPSGAFLDELLGMVGLDRSRVYLTNMVLHRVPEGRPLQPGEIAACADHLTRLIAAIDPHVIVAMGSPAVVRFFPGAKVSRVHGQVKRAGRRIVVAMYNPAAALHREELRQAVVNDFQRCIPQALAEAQRLGTGGATSAPADDEPPQQLALF